MSRDISIGIPVSTEPERLLATLNVLQRDIQQQFDLVSLLDAPEAPMNEALQTLTNIQQLGLAGSSGPAACFNRLAIGTQTKFVVLLENGCSPGAGWLERLIAALNSASRIGLAGPSTNRAWNEQAVFREARHSLADVGEMTALAAKRFSDTVRTLEPLYSLADFCYAVRREVIEDIGSADESYGLGPCWEMDYNIRAARAGWHGVWVCGAYVHRAPFTERRQREEARLFEASKRRYQDKFCGARLRGEKTDYRTHCRSESCQNFAPARLLIERGILPPAVATVTTPEAISAPSLEIGGTALVSCIMPTCDRLQFVPRAVETFLRQDYRDLELIVVDDGVQPVEPFLPADPRIRLIRLPKKDCIGKKRNIACAAARGEVIVHWDDDDRYPRDRLRVQAEALSQDRFAICGTSILFYHEHATGRAWRYCYVGGRAWVAGNTLAYRKSWWAAHPFPEIEIGEDSRFV